MAIKLIVLVVLAAAAQASSASTSDIQAAKETTLAAWSGVFQTVCRATQDESLSLEDLREEYRAYQISGGNAFLNLAPGSNDTALRIETSAFSAAFRDALFRGIRLARKCENYSSVTAEIEGYKTQLPYDKFIQDFHAVTDDTGSYAEALELFEEIYAKLFLQVERLATSVCGGASAVDDCSTAEVQPTINEYVELAYSWL